MGKFTTYAYSTMCLLHHRGKKLPSSSRWSESGFEWRSRSIMCLWFLAGMSLDAHHSQWSTDQEIALQPLKLGQCLQYVKSFPSPSLALPCFPLIPFMMSFGDNKFSLHVAAQFCGSVSWQKLFPRMMSFLQALWSTTVSWVYRALPLSTLNGWKSGQFCNGAVKVHSLTRSFIQRWGSISSRTVRRFCLPLKYHV